MSAPTSTCRGCGKAITYRQVATSGSTGEPVLRWCVDVDDKTPGLATYSCSIDDNRVTYRHQPRGVDTPHDRALDALADLRAALGDMPLDTITGDPMTAADPFAQAFAAVEGIVDHHRTVTRHRESGS